MYMNGTARFYHSKTRDFTLVLIRGRVDRSVFLFHLLLNILRGPLFVSFLLICILLFLPSTSLEIRILRWMTFRKIDIITLPVYRVSLSLRY